MNKKAKIGVIGSGSWATAIVKMLSENNVVINWWVRNESTINYIKSHSKNPNYLSNISLNPPRLFLSSNINDVINTSDYLVLAVPSAFIKKTLEGTSLKIKEKVVFSAIKGIVPEENTIVGEYIHNQFKIPYKNIGVITGPCHAEEVGIEKLSYLTIACSDTKKAEIFSKYISSEYIRTSISDDIYGTEYSAVLKNIISIAVGMCRGLGYGDNFQATLVANAICEIDRFLAYAHPVQRDIKESAYLGDLLVTSYSKFSRNGVFGEMIGRGKTIKYSQKKLKMIAEGYYAVKCIKELNNDMGIRMPITDAVYNVLYEGKSVEKEMRSLTKKIF